MKPNITFDNYPADGLVRVDHALPGSFPASDYSPHNGNFWGEFSGFAQAAGFQAIVGLDLERYLPQEPGGANAGAGPV